ncbi:MAG: HEAT repeat domain-containing protein [Brasilonema angustatum HA4187-MV1]|jgi:HEAT repeat protein/energy-coupling factor transporter ATP-binding protein EcfA2|nr:HEAT repeat domain-containing protein [Brasilonema angustatum HA4187-MV1]
MNVSGGKGYEQKDNKGNIYNADTINIGKDSLESEKIPPIDWRKVCDAMLEHQQESQRLRRKVTEMGCEVNVHVPLGLVERKQQSRRGRDETCHLNEVYEVEKEAIAQIYQHDEFLQQVIEQTPTGKNKHVAIIGEPGAGKTTLLGAIASFIKSQTENFPIFISLASLEKRTLEEYLLKTWLPEAMRLSHPEVVVTSQIEPQIQQEFIKRFQQGGVWLLLDAVDEMGFDSPVRALDTIQKQLTSWLTQARVVLTCRLNVWDASVNNPLSGFDTYRTQDFQPEQIDEFIHKWFADAKNPQRGEQLQTKLKETGRERICELVKNPLRLALLCQIFYLDKQAELPKTKAGLYDRFRRYFYEWKHNDVKNLKELHWYLGKLAQEGIDSPAIFRLRESLAKEMDEKLFKLACDLGWLNLVDRDSQTDEAVYAFFYPTFQEYFAACAIQDWDFFLPREHKNKPVCDSVSVAPAQERRSHSGVKNLRYKPYRIFEPQWKEVILLWLGREDVESQQKEQFIQRLRKFKDGCANNKVYAYRAYFLAAAGIAEFKDYPQADAIVAQIIEWSFDFYFAKKEEAKTAIQQTDRTKAIKALVELIEKSQDEYIRWRAADSLGEIDKGNPTAIKALVELIEKSQHEESCREAAESLGQIGKDNPTAIKALVKFIENSQDEYARRQAAESLGKIDKDNPTAIKALVELIEKSQDEYARRQAVESLGKIGKDNSTSIKALVELIENSQDEFTRRQATYSLGEIGNNNPTAIKALIELIQNSQSESIRRQAAYSLEEIGKDNPTATNALVDLIQNFQSESIRRQAVSSLEETGENNATAIKALVESIQNSQSEFTRWQAAYNLGQIGKDNPTAIKALVELIQNSQSESTRRQAAESLGQIGKNNPTTIKALVELIQNSQSESTRRQAAESLRKIDKDNPTAIKALVELIQNSQSEYTRKQATEILWGCAENMPYPKFYQLWHEGRGGVFKQLLNFINACSSG